MKAQVPFFNAIQDGFLQRTALQIVDLVQQLPDQRAGNFGVEAHRQAYLVQRLAGVGDKLPRLARSAAATNEFANQKT